MTTTTSAPQKVTRYRRGVQRPRPELLDKVREALQADPKVTKSELARRVGTSRQTVLMYLRVLAKESATAVTTAVDALRPPATVSHLDLSE